MANLSKAVCLGESDKCRFGNLTQESNFRRFDITQAQSQGCMHMLPTFLYVMTAQHDVRNWR